MPMRPDTRWVWTSPNGRITHTYTPQTFQMIVFWIDRGWTVRSTAPTPQHGFVWLGTEEGRRQIEFKQGVRL